MQYSISNLNAFFLLISIGFSLSLYFITDTSKKTDKLQDKENSPIQLISQLKGYFYINPVIALSLAITLFSFIGVPPLIGFFGKQMILSSAMDNGYIFMSLIAILTSVISAVYYLAVIKQIFFERGDYKKFNLNLRGNLYINNIKVKKVLLKVVLSNYLSITISILTLIILFFILTPTEAHLFSHILSLIFFNN